MRTILTVVVLALITASPLGADVIDPDSRPIEMLNELAGALDRSGVDVLFDHGSKRSRSTPP